MPKDLCHGKAGQPETDGVDKWDRFEGIGDLMLGLDFTAQEASNLLWAIFPG